MLADFRQGGMMVRDRKTEYPSDGLRQLVCACFEYHPRNAVRSSSSFPWVHCPQYTSHFMLLKTECVGVGGGGGQCVLGLLLEFRVGKETVQFLCQRGAAAGRCWSVTLVVCNGLNARAVVCEMFLNLPPAGVHGLFNASPQVGSCSAVQ